MNPRTLFLAFLLFTSPFLHAKWTWLKNAEGNSIEVEIVSTDGERLTLLRKSDRQKFTIDTSTLSEESQDEVKEWQEKAAETQEVEEVAGLSKSLYPRSKIELKKEMMTILDVAPQNGVSEEQQKAVNQLNIYRYLCGVPPNAEATPKKVAEATDAAEACEKNGALSHELGHSTNVCNISSSKDYIASVSQYIEDSGDNNRAVRGHRRWCLNPEMVKTGFGSGKTGYSAMWALDTSGKKLRDSWSYPGKGFFPHERLHGNAWTLYLNENAPAKDSLKIEVWELQERPEKAYSVKAEINGKALPVAYISTTANAINFEPESGTVGKGIYWVRIHGGGVNEGYVVELY